MPPLIVDSYIYSDSTDKANVLNDSFTEQSSRDDRYAPLPTEFHLPDYMYILDSITVTPYDVESIISSLQLGKATGHDVINNIILEVLKDVLSTPPCDLLMLLSLSLKAKFQAYGRKSISRRSIHQMQLITGLFHS